MTKSIRIINNLYLKIIAVVFMVLDHIAMFLIDSTSSAYFALRLMGRISFPLFVFLSIEALYHSRNVLRYVLILIISGICFDFVCYFFEKDMMGNTFIDLGLGVLTCHFLKKKNLKSLLAIFPATYLVLTDIFSNSVHSEYGTYGLFLTLALFLSYEITHQWEKLFAEKNKISFELIKNNYDRKLKNIYSSLMLILVNVLFYVLYRLDLFSLIIPRNIVLQSYSVLSIIFILMYNGKRGYNNIILKYSFYVFYPLHIMILYIIRTLII